MYEETRLWVGVWGGAWERVLPNLVPMLEQKIKDKKRVFFKAVQCVALSSFRVGKKKQIL